MKPAAATTKAKKAPRVPQFHEPRSIEEFWKSRAKNPNIFTFTSEGDAIFHAEGIPEKRFPLPSYRARTAEEINKIVLEKRDNLATLYETYDEAVEELQNAMFQYQRDASPDTLATVLAANQNVNTLDTLIATERYPQRWITIIPRPSVEDIASKKIPIDRKLEFDVNQLCRTMLSNNDYVTPIVASDAVTQPVAKAATPTIIITEEKILGLHWPADIQVEKTTYSSPFQAVYGEMALLQGDQGLYEALLGTRSERTIRSLVAQVADLEPEILDKVIRAMTEQVEEFKRELLATGDVKILFESKVDPLFATDNLWGKSLMRIRTALREETVVEADGAATATKEGQQRSVITKEEQRKAKTGAIVTQRKVARGSIPLPH